MMKRNLSLGLPVPAWIKTDPFLYEVWFSSQDPVAYEVSEIKKELLRISKIHDPREQFVLLMRVEERLDLLALPDTYDQRSSLEVRFRLMSFIQHWYNLRKTSS
jgi:hypothetical protein